VASSRDIVYKGPRMGKERPATAPPLHRFLTGETILARPSGRVERLTRWCRRNPRVAALSAVVLLLLTAVAAGSTIAALRIRSEKQVA
jgi:hypothetical protein